MADRFAVRSLFLLLPLALASGGAFAAPAAPPSSPPKPCALLTSFNGDVELIDPTRTRVIDTVEKAAIPCGGWLSVADGWAKLRHRDGHVIHAGRDSFVQVVDYDQDGGSSGDHLAVLRGEVYVNTGDGSGELRVITANARARIKEGAGIIMFSQLDDETQLVMFEKSATFENRFVPGTRMLVRSGEASSMNFRALRVVPSEAAAVTMASMRPRLAALQVLVQPRHDLDEIARPRPSGMHLSGRTGNLHRRW